MIKAAQECELSAGHARLAARAYNVGRAAFQRDTNPDLTAKIASFQLADPELVVNELERNAKQAAASVAQPVSAEYSQPPTFLRALEKQATAEIDIPNLCTKPVGELPAAHTTDAVNACSTVRSLQRKVADMRSITNKMLRDADAQLDHLQRDFRAIGAPSINTLRKAAEIRKDKGVLAVLSELDRRDDILQKTAASTSPVLTETEQTLYKKAAATAELLGEFIVANKKLAEISDVTIPSLMQDAMAPYRKKASADNDPFFEINSAATKQAGLKQTLLMPFTGAALGAHTDGHAQDSNVAHYQMALDDPGHDQTLRGLRARTTLEALRVADPTLSGYSQGELIHGFNQIVRSAPDAAAHPLYMQAMLRRYLGQGNALDPDDVRSNVLAPQVEMNKSRLQELPKLPETRGQFTSGESPRARMQAVMQEAFSRHTA